MFKIKFLCCLNADGQKTRKWTVESIVEVDEWDRVQTRINLKFSTHSDFGWKTEIELEGDLGATFSTGADSYPLTVHKMDKNGKKLWASYDRYEAIGGTWPEVEYRYWNENATDESQWQEYVLKSNGRWILKGCSKNERPLNLGYRRKWSSPEF